MYKEKVENLLEQLKEKKMSDLIIDVENACAIIFEYPAVVAFSEARECTAKVKYNKESKEYKNAIDEIKRQPEEALKAVLNIMNYINEICTKIDAEKCFKNRRSFSYEIEGDRFKVEKIANEMLKEFKEIADEKKLNEIYEQNSIRINGFEKVK